MTEKQKEIVYWTLLDYEDWKLYIGATERGLCYVGSVDAPFEELNTWVGKHISSFELIEDEGAMDIYENEIIDYLRGTEFQHKVWDELLRVPFGQSATYTEIAQRIQRPDAARAVGTAIGANPLLIIAPCHRMFGKNGEWRGYRGGLGMKKRLLEIENFDL